MDMVPITKRYVYFNDILLHLVKPYIPYDIIRSDLSIPMVVDSSVSSMLRVPPWIYEADVPMRHVVIDESCMRVIEEMINCNSLTCCKTISDIVDLITQVVVIR